MNRKVRYQGNGLVVGVPKAIIELMELKEGESLKYSILKNGTVKLEKVGENTNDNN